MPLVLPWRRVSRSDLDNGHELVAQLIQLYDTKTKLNGDKRQTVKCTTLKVPEHSWAELRSWKFDEFSYGKPDKPLPTDARGLFSFTDQLGRHEIVIRGYDKFFNTDEVAITKWDRIEAQTKGPYDLTLKQNGCIIFVGALPDGTILVTSKHSLGGRDDVEESHAERGRKWLTRHLAKTNITEQELAHVLLENRLTAVCELCDDEFEEHILGYPPDKSGLYLHGLNVNVPEFRTYPIADVNSFAKHFGFMSNTHLSMPDLVSMRALLDECATTGTYQGTEVEGFVIRTMINDQDFFFKYKFEEPYLLFRQWREVTKALIAGHEPRYKSHQAITLQYLEFIKPLVKDPVVAKRYNENHGIISLRQQFLNYRGGSLADIIANPQPANDSSSISVDWYKDRFVLTPIATIGCGKTTIALALRHLFGFGHIQNDNILAKKSALQFASHIYDSFSTDKTRVVIADRNNHMFHERASLMKDLEALKKFIDPPIRFIALSFSQSSSVRSMTIERVLQRGDNHQSIRAATMDPSDIQGIMDGFHKRFQALSLESSPDEAFADVIELDTLQGSRANLETVVCYLHTKGLIRSIPRCQSLDEALAHAINYRPEIHKHMTSHPSEQRAKKSKRLQEDVLKQKKTKQPNFFALCVLDPEYLFRKLVEVCSVSSALGLQWSDMVARKRVQNGFHVTLIHQADKQKHNQKWNTYDSPESGLVGRKYNIELREVVTDGRVMAITVEPTSINLPLVNKIPHITIGTANASIKPFESNAMLADKSMPESVRHRAAVDCIIECQVQAYH